MTIGGAAFAPAAGDGSNLMARVDRALKTAKERGGNCSKVERLEEEGLPRRTA